MQATDILMQEHEVILRVIGALEIETDRLAAGQDVRPGFFLDAADFIKGFADGCHHKKEEGVLFEAMTAAGLPQQSGPIGVMLAEHEQGRALHARHARCGQPVGGRRCVGQRRGGHQCPRVCRAAAPAHPEGERHPLPDGRPGDPGWRSRLRWPTILSGSSTRRPAKGCTRNTLRSPRRWSGKRGRDT